MAGSDTRELAFEILRDYGQRDAYLNALLAARLADSPLAYRDRALVTELVQGTVRMKLALDHRLAAFSDRPLEEIDPRLLWVLRLAVYQLRYMGVAEHAACDTAVEVAKRQLGQGAAAFANGVLRALLRAGTDVPWPDPVAEPVAYLERRYSHPAWVVALWIDELGFDRAESLCVADNEAPRLSVRVNLNRVGREAVSAALTARGIEAEDSSLVPEGLLLKGSGPPEALEEFANGLISVQDQGSMMVARAVAPKPDMGVVDMCAAPGGKANHLAELMRDRGEVLALDVSDSRLKMVADAAARLGNASVSTMAIDATAASSYIPRMFDRVLVDAPCTGLGTLARRPDVRWRKRPEDVERLAELQAELLAEGAKMVRPGGMLAYSTCTISRRENQQNLERFMSETPGFTPVPADRVLPGASGDWLQLYPDEHRCDGIFVAVLRRLN